MVCAVEKRYEDTAIICFVDFNFSWETSEEPHITLLFLGPTAKLDKDDVLSKVEELASKHSVIEAKLGGIAVFSPNDSTDGKYPVVQLVDSPELTGIRAELEELFPDVELTHGFTPHITLDYVDSHKDADLSLVSNTDTLVLDTLSVWWGNGEQRSFSLQEKAVNKALPIKPEDWARLADVRQKIFNDKVDDLADKLYRGDITLGQWEESFRSEVRSLWTSLTAMAKGGWENVTQSDWGRLGNLLKKEYGYLHNFAKDIDSKRDSVSLAYLKNRSSLYGNTAQKILGELSLPIDIIRILRRDLGGIPRDGSSECLGRCLCRISLEIVEKTTTTKTVKATWEMRPAEHCNTCVSRNKKTTTFTVPIDQPIPSFIGGYGTIGSEE